MTKFRKLDLLGVVAIFGFIGFVCWSQSKYAVLDDTDVRFLPVMATGAILGTIFFYFFYRARQAPEDRPRGFPIFSSLAELCLLFVRHGAHLHQDDDSPRARRTRPLVMGILFGFFGMGICSAFVAMAFNGLLDFRPAKVYEIEIESIEHKRITYNAFWEDYVIEFKSPITGERVTVNYYRFDPEPFRNGYARIYIKPGLLGWPWCEKIEPIPERG